MIPMKEALLVSFVIYLLVLARAAEGILVEDFRPPATPLLLLNPTIQV
jgi:hypothetical protein